MWAVLVAIVSIIPCPVLLFLQTCPPTHKITHPHFVTQPLNVTYGVSEQTIAIKCCIDGYTTLQWSYRPLNVHKWSNILTESYLWERNSTLVLIRPLKDVDDGYYMCSATDDNQQSLSHSTFAYFMYASESRNVTLDHDKSSNNRGYKLGDVARLECRGHSYWRDEHIAVRWSRDETNWPIITAGRTGIDTTRYYAYNKSLETNPDLVTIVSKMTINDLQLSDGGQYRCEMQQKESKIEIFFRIDVISDSIQIKLVIILISCGFVTLSLIWLIWYYLYCIIIFYKTYLNISKKGISKEIDICILHSDSDNVSLWLGYSLVRLLECHGFSCWFLERDKEYGSDLKSNITQKLQKSYVALIIVSVEPLKNMTILTNIASCSFDPSLKRIYLLNPSKKCVIDALKMHKPYLIKWIKNEFRFQFFLLSTYLSWKTESKMDLKNILTWILATLPSHSIRRVRKKLLDKEILNSNEVYINK